MKKSYWWIFGTAIGLVLIASSIYIFLAVFNTNKEKASGEEEATEAKHEEMLNNVGKQDQEITPSEVPSETEFQSMIHHLTHQKVEADEKWGKLQITPERIDKMLAILTAVEGTETYEFEDVYRDILKPWDEGNFDNAVNAHNRIWQLQGGTIGKATGLLSEAEEQEYIEKNY
ncbi:DUF6241 domain-containing protein [Thalassobacillus pellis]|uniref:DUF6241 domain-containing protein n=1 Tax=Thalassobacillus pellis TaxID=748008 RepID=UPI0019612A01|nr:DUF6241 domain-containing protein [Thalassobacillus pellis]MBM7552221.1 hypothetical protein [Thalassobacillus pellis]